MSLFMLKIALDRLAAWSLLLLAASTCKCVNLDKWNQLNKQDLLKLDRQVSAYYYESYENLDSNKRLDYNKQLLRSIRAIRHTTVMNHFDYIYTDEQVMRQSAGPQVSSERCPRQLEALERFARLAAKYRGSDAFSASNEKDIRTLLPLSAIDMLESSARTESGVLNGNFVWLGSYTSCQHASISYRHIMESYEHQENETYGTSGYERQQSYNSSDGNIVGRYCVAHLRAKSWPKDDAYFGGRLTLKTALCLPETCHTGLYEDSPEVRESVERLTKFNMIAPFDSDQYEVAYLYCLPDEDSDYRRWDLGSKLFVVFVGVWSVLLLYSNIKYQQRLRAMKKLSESVDIKMIVELNLVPTINKEHDHQGSRSTAADDQMQQNLGIPGVSNDGTSSTDATPLPSDTDGECEEQHDGEFRTVKPVLLGNREADCRRRRNEPKSSSSRSSEGPFDFVRAFAVKANIDYLFQRNEFPGSKFQRASLSQSTLRRVSREQHQAASASASPSSRRLSASNAALIEKLEKESCRARDNNKNTGRFAAGEETESRIRCEATTAAAAAANQAAGKRKKRVNINVLDGIKVFATCYIVYSHTLMFFFGVINDIRFGHERMLDFTMIATINGLQVVGLFYIITGLLISYLAFSRQKAKQLLRPSFWLIVIVGRYLRLLPAYFLVFWFAKHVAPFTGSGPDWLEYRTDSQHPRGFCSNESWLTMLTMSAADVKIPYDCVPQTWYLSNDFRTLLILPLYIIILALNTTAGYAAIFSTLIFSTFKMIYILRDAHIDYNILLSWQPHVYNILVDRLHDVYTNLSIRLCTYLLGVILGHILYLYDQGQIKRMPRWFKRFGLKLALLVGSMSFMIAPLMATEAINRYLPSPDTIESDLVVYMIPFLKITMELCICFTLLALTTGGGFKWLTELLSSQPARVLSNISYGVFLVHIEVMYKSPVTKFESNYYYLYLYSAFFIVLSNAIAFFVHVLYEMPINNALRYVFKKIFNYIVK